MKIENLFFQSSVICNGVNPSKLRCDGLVVSMFTFEAEGARFVPLPGHIKDNHKNDTNCLPALYIGMRVGVWHCSLTV